MRCFSEQQVFESLTYCHAIAEEGSGDLETRLADFERTLQVAIIPEGATRFISMIYERAQCTKKDDNKMLQLQNIRGKVSNKAMILAGGLHLLKLQKLRLMLREVAS